LLSDAGAIKLEGPISILKTKKYVKRKNYNITFIKNKLEQYLVFAKSDLQLLD